MEKQDTLTDLFTIESSTEQDGLFQYELKLNPKHIVFEGHFPELPVLPGVCMLYMIKSCISITFHSPVQFTSIRSCKFISVVDPGQTKNLTVHFRLSPENKAEATLFCQEETILKLKATVQAV